MSGIDSTNESHSVVSNTLSGLNIALLIGVPLVFSTAVYRIYALPKFALLLVGTAALLPTLVWALLGNAPHTIPFKRLFALKQVWLVCCYLVIIGISTAFGVARLASLFGSYYNLMGLLTHLGFFILFISLIVATGTDEKRLRWILWAMALTGLLVSIYAFMQFFGHDLFLPPSLYTYDSALGPIIRVNSTVGHADYLGNFLLYTAPLSAGLALASSGQARRIGLTAVGLSIAAIAFTGTRGAWVGLVAGLIVFVAMAFSDGAATLITPSGPVLRRRAGLALIGFLLVIGAIWLNPASRNLVLRARAAIGEGFTGAGRTLLWRDSLRMVKDYALPGCGPEGFRRAFLPYKSFDLAHAAPEINNESSHNAYLDAAISYGLPGAILYVAILASSFALLINSRRRAVDKSLKTISTALIASLAAVAAHNFFIFDQISTGLYFFAFVALAQIVANVQAAQSGRHQDAPLTASAALGGSRKSQAATTVGKPASRTLENEAGQTPSSKPMANRLAPVFMVLGIALVAAAGWYVTHAVLADRALVKAYQAGSEGNFKGIIDNGYRAISHPDPTGDVHFLFANALRQCVDQVRNEEAQGNLNQAQMDEAIGLRNQAAALALTQAEQSLRHSLTPNSSYVLMAYLALQLGDKDKLFAYATEAVNSDPKFANARWLLAEAYLARGENRQAAREAKTANLINTDFPAAQSAYKRSGGIALAPPEIEKFLARSRKFIAEGKPDFARRLLQRIMPRLDTPCPDCHKELATLNEQANRYQRAIHEWQAYLREAPDRAAAEQIPLRIEQLKQKINPKQ